MADKDKAIEGWNRIESCHVIVEDRLRRCRFNLNQSGLADRLFDQQVGILLIPSEWREALPSAAW